jgi:ABC-type hemin transport system ATPase subunit
VVSNVRERLRVSKQTRQKFDMERFNLKKLKEVAGKEEYRVEIANMLATLETLDDDVHINRDWKHIRENIDLN